MAIRFLLPTYLRPFAGGAARLDLAGRVATVGAALELLRSLHPGVLDRVLTEQGEVRPHVNVFVGEENIRHTGGLATPLPDDPEISIVPAVSGGAHARRARARRFAVALLMPLAALSAPGGAPAAGNADLPHPRLGLYGHAFGTGAPLVNADGTLNTTLLDQVARYDAVVLSASPFTEYRPDVLAQLRLRNPSIRLYAYVQADYAWRATQPDSLVNLPTREWNLIRNLDGFLYDTYGGELAEANINLAKRSKGRYAVAEALSDYFRQAVLAAGPWDGLCFDRFCSSLLWAQTPGDSIDFVRAGYSNAATFDAAWHAAGDTLVNRLRRLAGNTPVLIGNCAQSTQYASMNGWMHENFPLQNGGTWDQNLFRVPGGYLTDEANFRAPQSNWLVTWGTDLTHPYAADQVRRVRFGLGSAAMADGFGVFNPSDIDPTTGYMSWWYDEYAVNLATGRASNARVDTGWLGRALGPYGVLSSNGIEDAAAANPGFEVDIASWTLATSVGSTLQRDPTTAALGAASGLVHVSAAGTGPSSTRLTTAGYISTWAGAPYVASFWARAGAARSIRVVAVDAYNAAEYGATTLAIDGTWRRYTVSISPPASGPVVYLQFQLGGAAVDAWLDDVHLVRTGINLYRRDFERGTVVVNPTASPLSILLEQPYRRILGTIDPVTNDGSGGSQFSVPGNDALFLIRATSLTGVAPAPTEAGSSLAWATAAPNPALAGAPVVARLLVPRAERATVFVYDARGRRVRLLFDGRLEPGTHALEWDGADDRGQPAPHGLYFLRAAQGGAVATRKLVRV
ncbi:MAG: FlgD immunoglobulin-like domain containing protein [Candidatus Eisenbacteria bacterium]